MYELISKIKEIKSIVEDNREIAIIAEQTGNTKQTIRGVASMKEIDDFTYGRCFKISGKNKKAGKIELLTKFADEDFYVKDSETGELYMSVSEDLGEKVKKITILKCSEGSSEFYSYLSKNGQNDLIRLAITDNENDRKLVVTNEESHKLTNEELLHYAREIELGGLLENILAQNMDGIKDMIANLNDDEDEIKKDADDLFEKYTFREDEYYSEVKNDEDVQSEVEEYLKKYKVTLNGQKMENEKATIEIGNAMTAIDEEEVQRPKMWNYCFDLNASIKLQIARTQGIIMPKFDTKEY